ncbi:DotU family type IV/VI secretion system protein [Paraburkholderia sp. BL10I2N1]|uniref:DotU family type IV/VI secretion system protein n=1 Tax=Paraburkholderia sp. BL10I2N1 TaxID=1938796 RepID=UPI0010F388B6|nr:DotU family type IV/VI secretion system protein [Paraburkholderia sp. BL10I2N1]TDN57721.1 type VI secretion system (T6SS) protein DotU [Paraburkholderia sp. BL10I2N1]TDN59334.1 type VI secretion system (T6SS) protein DotU [Paraburkholderia sp. BL10I2N1]
MTILTSRHSGDSGPALMGSAPAADRVSSAGIRDLLRDTALLVTSLAPGGTVTDAAAFRDRCRQLIGNFSDSLTHRGYPEDVRLEAMVAQCGLLDETALRELGDEARSGSQDRPHLFAESRL